MNFGYELACPTVYFLVQAVDGVQFFANKSCFFKFSSHRYVQKLQSS